MTPAPKTRVLMRLGAHPKVRAVQYEGMPMVSMHMPSGRAVIMNLAVAHALGRKLAKAAMEATAEDRRRRLAAKQSIRRIRPASAARDPASPR